MSAYIAIPWANDIADVTGSYIIAWSIISGIALVPGFANAFILSSLLADKRPQYGNSDLSIPITILIAAYNEQDVIKATLDSIVRQGYSGPVSVYVIDDGSTDNTANEVRDWNREYNYDNINVVLFTGKKNAGKSAALNWGLDYVQTEYVLTIDADTYLYKNALKNIVANMFHGPANTAAVAGNILVRNSRKNWLTRMQEFDYFLGIGVVKRTQSLFQGTLVAQGAFSIYLTEVIREAGGWREDCVGEDIVLTWGMRVKGYRVAYAENAFAFTNVPENYKQFFNQRLRWSRGLIEGFRAYPEILLSFKKNTPFIYLNLLFPITDAFFAFVFVPSIFAALFFDYYLLVSLMTLLLLPLAFAVNLVMFLKQRKTLRENGLQIRRNYVGFFTYMLFYQLIMVPSTLMGYWQEILKMGSKSWGTK